LWDFSPPHFCGCWKPAVSFIATAKTSYTAETLCEMAAKIFWNYCIKNVDKNVGIEYNKQKDILWAKSIYL
jgi:hypothetical protein